MAALTLPSVNQVLVVSPIWDKIDKLLVVEKLLPQYDYVILNGGICCSFHKLSDKLEVINQLSKSGKIIYNVDDQDLMTAKQINVLDPTQLHIEKWIKSQPNIVLINFSNGFQVNIINGGLPTLPSREALKDNLEVSFITHDWHAGYSGGMGYTISNYPLTRWAPKFYRYSVQIGNYPENQVYGLHLDQYGVQKTIIV